MKSSQTFRVERIVLQAKGEDLLIIENVPVDSCPNCGESYLTAGTLHEIERIKLHRKSLTSKRTVAVTEFI